jgi:DNA-binding NarL/FixJ family response regulator
MPELDGVSATRQILRDSPHVRIMVLTMFDDDDSVFAAMRAGAHGYLLKGAGYAEVRHAVHLVAAGGAMFGPAVAQRVIDFFARPRPASVGLAFPQLTDREHEILDLLAQGHPSRSTCGCTSATRPCASTFEHLHQARRRRPRAGDRPGP